jgi:hypothetical protein
MVLPVGGVDVYGLLCSGLTRCWGLDFCLFIRSGFVWFGVWGLGFGVFFTNDIEVEFNKQQNNTTCELKQQNNTTN